MQSYLMKLNALKIGIISISLFIFGAIICGVLWPIGFKKLIQGQLTITPNSALRPMYTKVPFFIDFRIRMFNLLNPDEVTQGGKPKVEEIGPYFFEEWKEKFDLEDDEEEDILRYHYKNTFIFRPDLSGPGLTGNEVITMIHPLIATMFMALNVDKQPLIPMINEAINIIFHEPQHMFWTGRVMDVLFDGIPIDCSDTESFQVKAVCGVFQTGEVAAVRPLNDTHFLFSLFYGANGTDIGEFTVFRGKKNSKDLGRVVAWNGDTEMDVWDGDECNEYAGTDSSIFPPFTDITEGLFAYEPAVCRSLAARYVGKSKYMGIKTAEYGIDIGSEENAKECFCRDPPDGCPKRGTFDLFRCVGAPMIGSLPHFYNCDPSLAENFASGINPNKKDHDIYMHIETTTGSPLSAAKRLQFNLEVVPIEEVPYLANLREMYYPLFWVEEAVQLNKTFTSQIKHTVVLIQRLQKCFKWIGIIIGLIGLILSGVIFYLKENADGHVTKETHSNTKSISVKSVE